MTNRALRFALPLAIFAVAYQLLLADIITLFGPWRVIQPISDFPHYSCQRLRDPALEGCEDMWLDDDTRLVYAACTGAAHRMHWSPTVQHFNTSMRPVGGSWISVLDLTKRRSDGSYEHRKARFLGYDNAVKGGPDLLGFDVEILANGKRRFWLINRRPPVDANGEIVDAAKTGDNATIDVFDMEKGGRDLHFVKTIWNKHIHSPNKPAAVGDGSVVVTNDISSKDGFRRHFDMLLGGGSIAYCYEQDECHIAAPSGFKLPNGMVRGKDGYFWVPNSMRGDIMALYLDPETKMMHHVTSVRCDGMSVDNLSVDRNGHLLAAALPAPLKFFKHTQDPFNFDSPSTVFEIVKVDEPNVYRCDKIIEDRDAVALGGASVAVRDVASGTILTSGPMSPYITVCRLQAQT